MKHIPLNDNIAAVRLLEERQLYKNKNNWGLTFSRSAFGDPIVMSHQVPDGTLLIFEVAYKNGLKRIIKTKAGSHKADQLLSAIDDHPKVLPEETLSLQKNQLPSGSYIIGVDIPEGVFDFTWVYGQGYLQKYKSAKSTTLGDLNYDGGYIGNLYEYEHKQCFHVVCQKDERLVIGENLIVSIERAKKIEIDL